MEILHPVSILNFLSSSSCNSARMKQILSELDNHRESYDVMQIFPDGGYTVANILCFLVLRYLAFTKAKNYLRIKFRPDISIHGRDVTTSGCWRQTSAIFKFYSRFRRTLHRHQHVILHWPTKFYANRIIVDGVMTSCWFYKMAAIASQMYFRFLVWPPPTCRKAQGYQHTKFWPDISICGWEIATSGLWKQTAAILKFYFRFRFWHVVFHQHTKFHKNRIICGRVMTS